MSYHNTNNTRQNTNIITYIDGMPLFSTAELALNHGATIGLIGFHTHTVNGVVGYMAGFTHDEASRLQPYSNLEESQKVINIFEINTQNLTTNTSNRPLKISGDVGSEFSLQVIQNSASTSVLDKFYNFTTKTFESVFNKNHILNVKLRSNFYSKNIIFPSTTVSDYRVLLIANQKSNTVLSDSISSSDHVVSRKIVHTSPVQIDFVFKTSNTSSYSANPPHANVTSTGTPGLVSAVSVDIAKTVTNASTDANGFGLIVTNGFSDATSFFIEQNQTVNGAITSATSFLLDDTSNITVGSVITAVDGGSLSGTPHITRIEENLVTISSAQTFADNRILTFKTTGVSNIETATKTDTSTGLAFRTANLSQRLIDIVNKTAAARTGGSSDDTPEAQTVTKTVRADGSVSEATDGSSNTVTLNGTYGIAGSDVSTITGLSIANNNTLVSEIGTPSASAGALTLNNGVLLDAGQEVVFVGSSQSVALTGAQILIDSYPTSALTVNLDLDTFITPGTAT